MSRLNDPAKEPFPGDEAEIEKYLAGLSHADATTRRRSVRALGKLGPAALHILPSLIAAFCDRDMSVRKTAVTAVSGLGRHAVPALLAALEKGPDDLRRVVVVTLGEIGPVAAEAVPALTAVKADEWLGHVAEQALARITCEERPKSRLWLPRLFPTLLAVWLLLTLMGLVGAMRAWNESRLFGLGMGALGSASVLGGMGLVVGLILGWTREGVRGLVALPLLLGLGGLWAGLLVGGLFEALLDPLSRILGRM